MMVILAYNGLEKKVMESVAPMMPNCLKSRFTGPLSLKMVLMVSKVTNWGTATDSTNMNLQNPFILVPLRLIRSASKSPRI